MTHMSRSQPIRRAYTLVEILITVVILGIAAAMVIPSMGDTGVLRVQAAVRQIISDIRYAQSEAVAHQRSVGVLFDPVNKTYGLIDMPASGTVTMSMAFQTIVFDASMGDATISSVSFANSMGNANLLIFDEQGTPVLSATSNVAPTTGQIVITGSGQTFTISIEGYTGRVTVVGS